MSLLKFLPIGTVLQFQKQPIRYHGWFTVALGGYATIDVGRFIFQGKELYFSLEIADSQFNLNNMLNQIMAEPFCSLNKDMQRFIVNYFNSLEM